MALTFCRSSAMRVPLVAVVNHSKTFVPLRNKTYGRSTAVFHERNKKGTDSDEKKMPFRKAFKEAMYRLGPETKLFLKEQREAYATNPMLGLEHGNYEVIYRFNDPSSVSSWVATADSDNQEGKSSANFTFSKNRTGLFHGFLNKEVPKDGVTKYAGYANISAPKPYKSFGRETSYDWSLFNCMLLRIRGDGRPYLIVIGCDFYYDVNWLNRWSCPLFTRGGPYWQIVKIPFSKFYTTHSGRIQDKQEYLPLNVINSVGITTADAAEGPFYLEIDSIALMYDINLSGKHAYELYQNKYYEVQS
ncbi:complex I intermediate-associated protein 30, mitochondrial [Aplysia californica]|uniref:Complex I intermediate-associated protein 30, mitochondrial n=1 Tax=Aplysia californica TaxID=6500 RepID=A0ABM0K062_APLCA|nr:complex I intermediate-associated protein 30, mitochondrial [Aplysia californica]XP_035827571.1 complex I intermediate-associated protein 30, mitochondrial [Aplysia californica]